MFDKSIWSGFDFNERYPGRSELRRYFDFIDSKLRFSDHTTYNANATGALWLEHERKWQVELVINGKPEKAKCSWFIPAIGFAAKAYIPKMKGMDNFKGEMHHSAVSVIFVNSGMAEEGWNVPLAIRVPFVSLARLLSRR